MTFTILFEIQILPDQIHNYYNNRLSTTIMHHFSTKQRNIFSNYQRVQRLTDGQTPLQGRYRHPKKRNKILIRFAKIVTSNVFRLFRPVLYFLPFSFHQNLQSFQRQKPGRSAILKTICTQTHTLSWWAAEGWGPRLHAIRFPAQFPRHLLVFDPYQDSIPTIAPWCLGRPPLKETLLE